MKIKYLGHSCFLVQGTRSVVTDPFSDIGYEMERVKADFCLVSHGHFDHNCVEKVSGAKVIYGDSAAGEGADIALERISTFHDNKKGALRGSNFVCKFTVDGVRFCHLGDIGEDFSKETADRIGGCDVLFIPVGGNYTIDRVEAKKYADAIAPSLIVPMHFKTRRSRIDIDGLDRFKSLYKSIINCFNEFCFDKETLSAIKKGTILLFDTDRF